MRSDDLRLAIAGTGRPNAPAPLRIVHVLHRPAGAPLRFVADLVEEQHKAGHHIGLLCDIGDGDGTETDVFARIEPLLVFGLTRVTMGKEFTHFRRALALVDKVKSLDPDILHGHGAKGGAYARMIGTRLRASGSSVSRIYSPHGARLVRRRRTATAWERALARFTDAFVFTSQHERDLFSARITKSTRPFSVAFPGLRSDAFAPVTPEPGARDFAFIGDLTSAAGTDLFIAALALLKHRSGIAPTASIVGGGTDEQKYRAVVTELGLAEQVDFHTARSAREAMALARTIVVPSREEGAAPYLLLDTIAAGLPLIATRVGAAPEIFGPDAERLVPPNDASALADAMASALATPGAALAKAAAINIRIRSTFTVEAMAATVESVYRALAPH
jgi:glycosyltransferase involved in cell wall biosynthesis